MSRDLTASMITEVTGLELSPAIFLKAEFDSGDLLLWSGVGDKVFNSETYVGAGNLLGISEIDEMMGVEAKGATFVLSGLNSSVLSLALTEDYQDRPLTVWLATLDSDGDIIADPVILFKGKMDVAQIDEGGETGTASMSVESDLIDLKRARVRRYTSEDQKQEYSADVGLDFVVGLQDKEITWGKS